MQKQKWGQALLPDPLTVKINMISYRRLVVYSNGFAQQGSHTPWKACDPRLTQAAGNNLLLEQLLNGRLFQFLQRGVDASDIEVFPHILNDFHRLLRRAEQG